MVMTTRRESLIGMIGLPLAAGTTMTITGCTSSIAAPRMSPSERLENMVRLRGDTSGKYVYLFNSGPSFLIIPGQVAVPFCDVETCAIDKFEQLDANTWQVTHHEVTHYVDHLTGELIDKIKNPITGEMVQPIHYLAGPGKPKITSSQFSIEKQSEFLRVRENEIGKVLKVTLQAVGKYNDNLPQTEWPKASVGGVRRFADFVTYHAQKKDILNKRLSSIPLSSSVTLHEPWAPWHHMSGREGTYFAILSGEKFNSADALPKKFRDHTEALYPGLLTNPGQYSKHINVQKLYQQREIEKRG